MSTMAIIKRFGGYFTIRHICVNIIIALTTAPTTAGNIITETINLEFIIEAGQNISTTLNGSKEKNIIVKIDTTE